MLLNPLKVKLLIVRKQILDREGIAKKEQLDINAKVAHGIFILPAKDNVIDGTTKSVSEQEA